MAHRRYSDHASPEDPQADSDRKPVREGPWAGRAWIRQDPEDGTWGLVLELDGSSTENRTAATFAELAPLAIADPRVFHVLEWSPATHEFVRHSRTEWAARLT